MTAARNGTAEIGLAVTATTFSIIAVFIPVAFMGGGAGEWFRPFALTVATSVLVSLFISFTLDPMLSAYWGDPPGYAHQEKKRASRRLLRALQRLVRPPGRPLRQRDRLGAAPPQVDDGDRGREPRRRARAAGHRAAARASCPPSDSARIAIDVRTPSSASLEYAQAQGREGRRAGAHHPRDQGDQQRRERRAAGASTSTSARARSASARRRTIAERAARAT